MPRRPPLRWVLTASGVVILVWLALVGLSIRGAATDARHGRDTLASSPLVGGDVATLVATTTGDTTDTGGDRTGSGGSNGAASGIAEARRTLEEANRDFRKATTSLQSPAVAPLRVLPFIGRQVRAVTSVSTAAEQITDSAARAMAELEALASRPTTDPAQRVTAVADTITVLESLSDRLAGVDLGPNRALVHQVAELHDSARRQLDQVSSAIDSAITGLRGVGSFLNGPTTYLVLAANNAEMRAGSGMFLQAGTIGVDQGRFSLSDFTPTADMFLPTPGTTMDHDMAARWGAMKPDQEWRNLNLSPRFDESARMAADMWAASGRGAVDGVIAVDIVTVQRLLTLTGPVDATMSTGEVVTYDADNVVALLAREQYFSDLAPQDRRDELGTVAAAVFDAFNQREIPATGLLSLISGSGAQRHLLMWSADPVQQLAWEELGVAGMLPPGSLMLALLNRGGNKLDPYMTLRADISADTPVGSHRSVTVKVTVANLSPDWLPPYVAGPVEGSGGAAGEYVGILALSVPATATSPTTSAGGWAVIGQDGPTRVIGSNVAIQRGQTTEVTFTFLLPEWEDQVVVVPGAREPATTWTAGQMRWDEQRPITVPLDDLS